MDTRIGERFGGRDPTVRAVLLFGQDEGVRVQTQLMSKDDVVRACMATAEIFVVEVIVQTQQIRMAPLQRNAQFGGSDPPERDIESFVLSDASPRGKPESLGGWIVAHAYQGSSSAVTYDQIDRYQRSMTDDGEEFLG